MGKKIIRDSKQTHIIKFSKSPIIYRNQRQFSVKERKTDVGHTCKQHLDLYERKNEKKRSFGDGR